MSKPLPAGFEDLARFTDKWVQVIPSESVRHQTRLNSSFEELKDLYDTLLPRMDAITVHLDRYKLGEMPQEERNLMELALGFMEVTAAVRLFKRAGIRGFDPARLKTWDLAACRA